MPGESTLRPAHTHMPNDYCVSTTFMLLISFVCCCSSLLPASSKWESIIEKDVPRTYPTHKLFAKGSSTGRDKLQRVLKATALHVPEIGYVQGMNFIAAYFLAETGDEETSFWLLVRVLHGKEYKFYDLYGENLSRLWVAAYQVQHCLNQNDPALALHFARIQVNTLAWLPQWILTIFTKHLKPPHMNALVEIFLQEGWPLLIKASVAILMIHRDKVLTLSFDRMLPYLNGVVGKPEQEQEDVWHAIDLGEVVKMLDKVQLPNLRKLEEEMVGKSNEERNALIEGSMIRSSKYISAKVTETVNNKNTFIKSAVYAGLFMAAAVIGGAVISKARR